MLVPSGAANISGNSVTTLTVNIGLIDGDIVIAPRIHHVPIGHSREPEQPLTVVRSPPRDDQGAGDDALVGVENQQASPWTEDRAGVFDQRKDRDLALLSVRLLEPPNYPARCPNTPAFLSSERTVSLGSAPLASHDRALSASSPMTAGLARGL